MKIADSHNDFLTTLNVEERIKYVGNFKIKILSCACFTTEKNMTILDVENYKANVEFLMTKTKCKLLFSIEDVGFLDFRDVERLINLKPFSVTLTWNYDNQYGGGAYGKSNLTQSGRILVKTLENAGILIDTAHMNRKTFADFLKITKLSIYNSHSNIYAIKRHKRNLIDNQIKSIVESGGYLGITLYDEFIGKNVSSLTIAKQFDYLIRNFGDKNFGFGTDFYGISSDHLSIDIKDYPDLKKVAHHLKKMGHSRKTINNIMWRNFTRFVKRRY